MHILLTRPLEDCSEMIIKFKSLGNQVSHLPLLRIDKVNYEQINLVYMLDPGESFTVTWAVSSNIGDASCWPTNSDGNYHLEFTHEVSASSSLASQTSDWEDMFGYDHSPIWIERIVDVTKSNDEGIIPSAVPGFESSYLIMCIFLAAMIHNRKNGFL